MATPNVALLKRTLEHIKDNPETWDQSNWCGTAQCFAGWAVTFAGAKIDQLWEVVHVDDMPSDLAAAVGPDQEKITVREAAIIALGIADSELSELPDMDDEWPDAEPGLISAASALFCSGNSLEDLEYYVAKLCGETEPAATS